MCYRNENETYQAPSDTGECSCHARVPSCGDRAHVRAERRPSVEPEPSEPEHKGAEGDEGDIVGPKVDEFSGTTTAQDPRVGETSDSGPNLDRTAASIIQDAPLETPTVEAPCPVRDGGVDGGDPEEAKDHGGHHPSTLCDGTHQNGDGDSTELELEEAVK